MAAVDYATELPDSQTIVNAHAEALINLLPSIATFLKDRIALEREYAKKLAEQASVARIKLVKETSLRGSSENNLSTLEVAWRNIVEMSDRASRERVTFAGNLEKVVGDLSSSGIQKEGIRKKHHEFAKDVQEKRDKAYAVRDKAKSKYYDSCTNLSSARSRLTVITSTKDDGRQVEKANKAFEQATSDMEIAKDVYLLETELSNLHKARLYNTDLPSVMSDFQVLESSTISHITALLEKSLLLEKETLGNLTKGVIDAETIIQSVDITADQSSFVTLSGGQRLQESFTLPPDLEWEESSVWHDTDTYSVTPEASTYLQNLSHHAQASLATLSPQITSARKEITGLRNLLEAYEKDRSLGDAGAVLEQLLEGRRNVVGLEIQAEEARSRIEIIGNTLGEETGPSRLHSLKPSSFVTPVPCRVCDGNVWGRGMLCKGCGCALHTKCELRIPANCGLSGGARSMTRQTSNASSIGSKSIRSNSTSSTQPGFLPPPLSSGRTRVPAFTPSHIEASSPVASRSVELRKGTMSYEYQALTAFELTVTEGEVVSILEEEDPSGWIKARTIDGREGLIPGSYLGTSGDTESLANDQLVREEDEPVVGQEAKALYDYTAEGDDELTLIEGDLLMLTLNESAEGWTEVEKDGVRGIVPSSYIEMV